MMELVHIRRPGETPPRGVITLAIDGKNLGMLFCPPRVPWIRKEASKIAKARLAGNPITVEQTRGTEVLEDPDLVRAATSLVQDRPGWTRSPDPESTAWCTSTLGPDGSMFHYTITTKERLPDIPAPRNISWLRVPSWAPALVQESS